jgi:WD40 repeat protein
MTTPCAQAQPTAPVMPTHVIELRPPGKKDTEAVGCVAFHPDGRTAYFGGGSAFGPGLLAFVDVKTGKQVQTRADHKLNVHSIAVRPDGKRIVTGGGYWEVKVWDEDGKLVDSLRGDSEHTDQVVFSADGKWLAGCGGELGIRDATKFERAYDTGTAQFGTLGTFTPDGKMLIGASAKAPGSILLLSVGDWKTTEYKTKNEGLGYYHPALSPDGKLLAVGTLTRSGRDFVFGTEVWAVKDGKLGEKVADVPGRCLGCAFTADGKHLLLGEAELDRENRVRVLEAATGKEVGAWVAAEKAAVISSLVVSPDGKILASCAGHAGKLWDLGTILTKLNEQKGEGRK